MPIRQKLSGELEMIAPFQLIMYLIRIAAMGIMGMEHLRDITIPAVAILDVANFANKYN